MAMLQVQFEKMLAAVKDLFKNYATTQDTGTVETRVEFAEFLNSTVRDIATFDKNNETAFSKNNPGTVVELTGDEMDLVMRGSPLKALEDAKKSIEKLDYLATPLEKLQIMKIELGKYADISDLHSIEDLCSTGLERLSVYHVGDIAYDLDCVVHCIGNGQEISDMYPDYGLIEDTKLSQFCMDRLQGWVDYERNNSNADDAHRWRSDLNTKKQAYVKQLEDKNHETTIKKPAISGRLRDAAVKCAANNLQKEKSMTTHEVHHRIR